MLASPPTHTTRLSDGDAFLTQSNQQIHQASIVDDIVDVIDDFIDDLTGGGSSGGGGGGNP